MRRKSCKYVFLFNIVLFVSLAVILAVSFGAGNNSVRVDADITTPLVYAESVSASFCENAAGAVLIDAKSGAVLFKKNPEKRYPMASTTKIMTALAVIENSDPDDVIEVSEKAQGVEGSSIYLRKGEKLTVRDLLYGLMLESGNDAAEALAIGVFGSAEKCTEYMNKRCREMGLIDTNFENVHGLDSENHYTTAYELALITKHAMNNVLFREIVASSSYVTGGENPRYFSNHNRLLKTYSPVTGVKTGYTSKSGRCLVSAASMDGESYIAVTLNDPLDWQDHKEMLSFAFNNFKGYEIADKDNFRLRVGFEDYVPSESVYITTANESEFTLNYRITVGKDSGKAEYSSRNMSLGMFGLERVDNREG